MLDMSMETCTMRRETSILVSRATEDYIAPLENGMTIGLARYRQKLSEIGANGISQPELYGRGQRMHLSGRTSR